MKTLSYKYLILLFQVSIVSRKIYYSHLNLVHSSHLASNAVTNNSLLFVHTLSPRQMVSKGIRNINGICIFDKKDGAVSEWRNKKQSNSPVLMDKFWKPYPEKSFVTTVWITASKTYYACEQRLKKLFSLLLRIWDFISWS